jgi:hypothetical protein
MAGPLGSKFRRKCGLQARSTKPEASSAPMANAIEPVAQKKVT